MLPQLFAEDVGRTSESGVRIAISDAIRGDDIGGEFSAHGTRTAQRALAWIGDGGKNFVLDLDQGGCVLRYVAVLRHDKRDRLADISDLTPESAKGHKSSRGLPCAGWRTMRLSFRAGRRSFSVSTA